VNERRTEKMGILLIFVFLPIVGILVANALFKRTYKDAKEGKHKY